MVCGACYSKFLLCRADVGLSMLEKRQGENIKVMKNTKIVEHGSNEADEMQAEYQFDYGNAKPNRFASRIGQDQLMIVLDPDVAAVFKTPESVNQVLRAIITSMPSAEKGD